MSNPAKKVSVSGPSLVLGTAVANDEKSGGGSSGDFRSAIQNPISSLISVPLKFSFDYGADNDDGAIKWPDNPSPAPGDGANTPGDINYSLYLSPV